MFPKALEIPRAEGNVGNARLLRYATVCLCQFAFREVAISRLQQIDDPASRLSSSVNRCINLRVVVGNVDKRLSESVFDFWLGNSAGICIYGPQNAFVAWFVGQCNVSLIASRIGVQQCRNFEALRVKDGGVNARRTYQSAPGSNKVRGECATVTYSCRGIGPSS